MVIDVGARWGFSSIWEDLGDRCLAIGFEPDAAECERLSALLRRSGSHHRLVPFALGAKPGMATLFVTRQPACSSIYRPSPAAYERHPGLDVMRPEDTTIIDMVTLDAWRSAEGIGRVDVLKVDTQGSELGVLEGATSTLESVSAVEVEVEFNELYEQAPLFSDVDTFLRRRGFVLWKLRDLAHYAQAGAPADWRTPDAWHLDARAFSFPGGPGQLYWANAYYLKSSVAYPDASAGWEQLVRNACVAAALGFSDLASVSFDLARSLAPAAQAAAFAAASGPAPAPVPAHPPAMRAGTLKLGFTDAGFTGGGWQPAQRLEHIGLRWSGPGRDAWVDLPFALEPGSRVELLMVAAMSPEISGALTLSVNRVPVALHRSPHEHGTVLSGVVPSGYRSGRGLSRLMLSTPATVPWNAINPESSDELELGVAIAWLRLSTPDTAAPA